jgi:hypothetical protein
MLVPVDHDLWLCPLDVRIQSVKPVVYFIILIMTLLGELWITSSEFSRSHWFGTPIKIPFLR